MEKQALIYQKMTAILNDINFIGKDKKNQQQGYSFRGIDDVYNELHPVFAKHNVFILPEVINIEREERQSKGGGLLLWTIVNMCFTFFCDDGTCVTCKMTGEAMDSGDKGCNKAMSVALKYALMQMFLIPTEENKDPENETPEVKSAAQVRKEEALALIEKSKDVDDLKQLKEMYKDLFLKDADIKAASKKRFDAIKPPAQPAQTA